MSDVIEVYNIVGIVGALIGVFSLILLLSGDHDKYCVGVFCLIVSVGALIICIINEAERYDVYIKYKKLHCIKVGETSSGEMVYNCDNAPITFEEYVEKL
jgi:hypothetical protein